LYRQQTGNGMSTIFIAANLCLAWIYFLKLMKGNVRLYLNVNEFDQPALLQIFKNGLQLQWQCFQWLFKLRQ